MKQRGSDILARFGQIVRARRSELKLTQEALAEKAELHRTYIADIERGTRNVSLVNIAKLAQGLACSSADLVTSVDGGPK